MKIDVKFIFLYKKSIFILGLKNLDDIFRNNIEPQGIIIKSSNSNLNPFIRKTDNTLFEKSNYTTNKKENNCLFNLDNFIIEKDTQGKKN